MKRSVTREEQKAIRQKYVVDDSCILCTQFVLHTRPSIWAKQGKKYAQSSDLLAETDSCLVVAGLGALAEGYVILLPKSHYLSIGALPQEQMSEFVELKNHIGMLLKRLYGDIIFFEHGESSSNRAGKSVVHAHLHACPCNADFRLHLQHRFSEKQISALSDLRDYGTADIPYLFYENVLGEKFVYVVSEHLPSQYLRRLWAQEVGRPRQWNWRVHTGEKNVARTISRIQDALSEGPPGGFLKISHFGK